LSTLLVKGSVIVKTSVSPKVQHLLLVGLALACVSCLRAADIVSEPYLLDTGLVSRSISFENPTGAVFVRNRPIRLDKQNVLPLERLEHDEQS